VIDMNIDEPDHVSLLVQPPIPIESLTVEEAPEVLTEIEVAPEFEFPDFNSPGLPVFTEEEVLATPLPPARDPFEELRVATESNQPILNAEAAQHQQTFGEKVEAQIEEHPTIVKSALIALGSVIALFCCYSFCCKSKKKAA